MTKRFVLSYPGLSRYFSFASKTRHGRTGRCFRQCSALPPPYSFVTVAAAVVVFFVIVVVLQQY
jgi:hypothetical protein